MLLSKAREVRSECDTAVCFEAMLGPEAEEYVWSRQGKRASVRADSNGCFYSIVSHSFTHIFR